MFQLERRVQSVPELALEIRPSTSRKAGDIDLYPWPNSRNFSAISASEKSRLSKATAGGMTEVVAVEGDALDVVIIQKLKQALSKEFLGNGRSWRELDEPRSTQRS